SRRQSILRTCRSDRSVSIVDDGDEIDGVIDAGGPIVISDFLQITRLESFHRRNLDHVVLHVWDYDFFTCTSHISEVETDKVRNQVPRERARVHDALGLTRDEV